MISNLKALLHVATQVMFLLWFRLHFVECQSHHQYELRLETHVDTPLYECYQRILEFDVIRFVPTKVDGKKAIAIFLIRYYLSTKIQKEFSPGQKCVVTSPKYQGRSTRGQKAHMHVVDFDHKSVDCGCCLFNYCEVAYLFPLRHY